MNAAGTMFPGRIAAWASYHPENFPEWLAQRRLLGGNTDISFYSHKQAPMVDAILPHERPSGSSALLGARVALKRGAARVVLAGCQLVDPGYQIYQEGWLHFAPQLHGRVRALSGWLAEFLGTPTQAWLEDSL